MNWVVFGPLVYLLLGIEIAVRDSFAIGDSPFAPSFVLPLLMFVGLHAKPNHARWAALIIGLTYDLLNDVSLATGTTTVVGPYAIGSLLAVQFAVAVRGVVLPKNILTLAMVTFIGALIQQGFVLLSMSVRSIYDPIELQFGAELLTRAGGAGYTALVALVMSFPLRMLMPGFGFDPAFSRRYS